MKKYTIGIDFGTLSARAVLMDLDTGETVSSAVSEYRHGIMTDRLPSGRMLSEGSALQVPRDYIEALSDSVRQAISAAGVSAEQIAGLGLDATASTVLPLDEALMPLCEDERFADCPDAYIKLWRHHSAQKYADMIEFHALAHGEGMLDAFGGHISGEHFLPKAAQTCIESPELYAAAYRIAEAGDWLVSLLCGKESRGYCGAAFKTYYMHGRGDIPRGFWQTSPLPELSDIDEKYLGNMLFPGDRAGSLSEYGATLTGLLPGTPVAAAGVDAHSTVYGCGVTAPGQLLLIIGTSTCIMLNSRTGTPAEGISGVVPDSVYPGMYTYECGQSGVGDMFGWFAANCVPEGISSEAARRGISAQDLLTELASGLSPGESGLIALDWWNGVRSTLMDFRLSGLITGLTVNTRPEEIYRTLLESTAFGCRRITDALRGAGVSIGSVIAAGGISARNPLLLQIYADVLGCDICVCGREQTGAFGSAVAAAAAASVGAAVLNRLSERYRTGHSAVYRPNPGRKAVYDRLYDIYISLYESMGRRDSVMHSLKDLQNSVQEDQRNAF